MRIIENWQHRLIARLLRLLSVSLCVMGIVGIAIVLLFGGLHYRVDFRVHSLKNPILFLAGGAFLAALLSLLKGRKANAAAGLVVSVFCFLLAEPADDWGKSRQASRVNRIEGKQPSLSPNDLRRIGASRLDQTFGRKDLRGGSSVPFPPATPLIDHQDDTPLLHSSLAKQLAEQTVVKRVEADGALRIALCLTPERPLHGVIGSSEDAVVKMGLLLKAANTKGGAGASAAVQISQTAAGGKPLQRRFEVTTSKWSDVQMEIPASLGETGIDFHFINNRHEESEVWISDPRVTRRNPGQVGRLVLIYVIDALRADVLSCYGYMNQTTDTMDELAAEGVVFERFYAQSSWTRASVGSLLTGTYPVTHGAIGRENRLSPRVWSLARHLAEKGFYTAGFTTNGNISGRLGFERGFSEYVDLFRVPAIRNRPGRVDLKGVIPWAEDVTDYVIPWLEENADRDLFVYIHTLDPHDPYTPPPRYRDVDPGYKGPLDGSRRAWQDTRKRGYKITRRDVRHLRALYDAEVKYSDDELGRFVRHLRGAGLWDRMLFILTGDHGEEFWEHGNLRHGSSLFEEQLRIPLIMVAPGRLPSGRRIWTIGEHVDLAATVCDFLALSFPEALPGRSLLPIIEGENARTRHVFSHLQLDGRHLASVRGASLKFVWDENIQRGALYHLGNDPAERRPVPRNAGRKAATGLWRYLQGWRVAFDLGKSPEAAEEIDLDPETVRQLEALGYAGGK